MAEPFFDGNAFALVKNGIVQDFFADFISLENDLVVNLQKTKQLTNVRASGTDRAMKIVPAQTKSLEEALEYITGHSEVWLATGREIAEYFIENYYESSIADIDTKAREVL